MVLYLQYCAYIGLICIEGYLVNQTEFNLLFFSSFFFKFKFEQNGSSFKSHLLPKSTGNTQE